MEIPRFLDVKVDSEGPGNNIVAAGGRLYIKVQVDTLEVGDVVYYLYTSDNKLIKDSESKILTLKNEDYVSKHDIDRMNAMVAKYKELKEKEATLNG